MSTFASYPLADWKVEGLIALKNLFDDSQTFKLMIQKNDTCYIPHLLQTSVNVGDKHHIWVMDARKTSYSGSRDTYLHPIIPLVQRTWCTGSCDNCIFDLQQENDPLSEIA